MNEFEWLRQTRALQHPHMPQRDLWPGIATRLTATTPRSRAWLPWTSAAAVVLVGLLLGAVALHTRGMSSRPELATSAHDARWKPNDPRLAGAAIEFDAARSELRLAMQQAPDAAFLHRILQRTRAQQQRLQNYPHETL